jgi:MerR-like DNA binding protein
VTNSATPEWEYENPWGRVRLDDRDYRGYWLDDELRLGFADDPELSTRERLVIAHWARDLTPEALSPEQERLLAENPPSVSRAQKEIRANHADLEAPYISALWESLSEEEQRIVYYPRSSPARPNARYPLTVGDLAAITGASERKIRNWTDEGLLPSFREKNDRRFYSAAVIRAFVLQRTPTHTKAVVAAVARGEASQAFQLIAAALGRAATEMPAPAAEQFSNLAKELSAASRLMT